MAMYCAAFQTSIRGNSNPNRIMEKEEFRQKSHKGVIFLDIDNFKNKFIVNRTKNNDYVLKGSLLNANTIITKLFESKDDQQLDLLKENIKLHQNNLQNHKYERSFIS
mgnify:CR=1 FL=1